MSDVTSAAPPAAAPSNAGAQDTSQNTSIEAAEGITPEESAELDSAEGAQKQAAPSKMRLRIDGQDVDLTVDEVKKYASLGKAAQARMQEAAEVRKQHDKLQKDVGVFVQMLQKDPAKVLADLGIDPDKFAEERMNYRITESEKTPEQKEREDLLQKLEESQKKLQEREESEKKTSFEKLQNEAATRIEKDISDAIDSKAMPKHPAMIRAVADLLMIAAAQGVDLEAKDVIPLVKKQRIEEFREIAAISPEEFLEEMLGEEKIANLRKRYLKKLRAMPTTPKDVQPTGQADKKDSSKEKQLIKSKDFFKNLGTF